MSAVALLALLPSGLAQTPTSTPTPTPPTPPAAGSGGALELPTLDVPAQAPPRYRADDVVLPRMPVNVRETPQSIDVIPRTLLEERGLVSLREALRNVTGISLSSGEGGFSGDSLTLRGFNANNDFYIDGIRDSANYNRDPFNVESIEVLKGPSSILFGRGSTGGIINQTTRQPSDGTFGQFTGTVFAPGGVRSTADLNMAVDQVAVRLNAMGLSQEIAGRDHVQVQRFGVAPSITWGLGGPTQFTLNYLHQQEENVPDFGIPFLFGRPPPVARGTFYGLVGVDRERYTTDVLTGIVQHRFDDGITLRNITRFGSYVRNINATEPLISGSPTTLTPLGNIMVQRETQVRAGISSILENQTELRAVVNTGSVKHSIVAGLEFGHETAQLRRYTSTRPLASLLSPDFDQGLGYTDRLSLRDDRLGRADRFGAFLVDQARIGQYFEVLGGVRFDRFDSNFSNRAVAGQNFSRTDDMFSWRGALVFKPADSVRTYVAAGTSFNPSVETLILTVANANLSPERNRSLELGGSWDITENLIVRGALFDIVKSNARTVDTFTASVNVLNGRQRVQGFELSTAGTILPNWNVIAGYTHLDSRVVKSNNPSEFGRQLINSPANTATIWTTYELPRGVTVGGGATYVDSRFANTTNTNRAPGYTRFDASVSWQINRALVARLNALNLTDKRYYEGVNIDSIGVGAGRTVLASLSIRF